MIPFFAEEEVEVKPKEQKLITIEAPFLEEISGMAITKLLDTKSHLALTLKLKFIRNREMLKVTNSTQEKVTFNPEHVVGIVDLRSLGYYKIKQGVLQQNLSHCYYLESAESVCDQYNRLINTLRKEEQEASVCGKEEGFLAYSSPVMLISRQLTKDKRVVTDFRHLNMRITKNNLAYPLLNDTFTMLGNSKCEIMSMLNLKDAFHSLRLTEKSKMYCGILPYFGSTSYLYQRIHMGLNISPTVWQSYINAILNCLSSRKYCEAIMSDLLVFMPYKKAHYYKLEELLKSLCKNGVKISPKKCQLFKTELQYMENTMFIKDR